MKLHKSVMITTPETPVEWDRFGEPSKYSPAFVSNLHLDSDGLSTQQIYNGNTGVRTAYAADFAKFVTCLKNNGISPR